MEQYEIVKFFYVQFIVNVTSLLYTNHQKNIFALKITLSPVRVHGIYILLILCIFYLIDTVQLSHELLLLCITNFKNINILTVDAVTCIQTHKV